MNITKKDIEYSLMRMSYYIDDMNKEDFDKFINGMTVNSYLLPPEYDLVCNRHSKEDIRHIKLEFRILC